MKGETHEKVILRIRNDGNQPTDEESEKLLVDQYKGIRSPLDDAPESVSPTGKLTTTWGRIKSQQ